MCDLSRRGGGGVDAGLGPLWPPAVARSLPDRNFVLGRMDGENAVEEGKRRERASRQEEIVPSRRQKPFEEDDHQFIRPSMRTMGPTSQGSVSALTCVSTRNPGVCRSIHYPIRQGRDASGRPNSNVGATRGKIAILLDPKM